MQIEIVGEISLTDYVGRLYQNLFFVTIIFVFLQASAVSEETAKDLCRIHGKKSLNTLLFFMQIEIVGEMSLWLRENPVGLFFHNFMRRNLSLFSNNLNHIHATRKALHVYFPFLSIFICISFIHLFA